MRRGGHFGAEDIEKAPAKQVYKAAPSKSICIFLRLGLHTQAPP